MLVVVNAGCRVEAAVTMGCLQVTSPGFWKEHPCWGQRKPLRVAESPPLQLTMIQPGSTARFVKTPEWVARMPEESRQVFEFCLGRMYRVEEIDDDGVFVLDVSADIDERFGGFMNDIRLEAEFLEEVI